MYEDCHVKFHLKFPVHIVLTLINPVMYKSIVGFINLSIY